MPDLFVKLYELPDVRSHIDEFQKEGVNIRKAMAYEKRQVVEWVEDNFGKGWAIEVQGSSPGIYRDRLE
jgi:hypothetical protein